MTHDNGGPAFPMPSGPEPRQATTTHYNEGQTLLDHFAGLAMQVILHHISPANALHGDGVVARTAYTVDEAMIAEKRRRESNV